MNQLTDYIDLCLISFMIGIWTWNWEIIDVLGFGWIFGEPGPGDQIYQSAGMLNLDHNPMDLIGQHQVHLADYYVNLIVVIIT